MFVYLLVGQKPEAESLCVLQEKQAATNRILLKKERASGFQGSRLDVVARFNGSTEALDRLDDPPPSAPPPPPSPPPSPPPTPAPPPASIPAPAASVGPGDAVSPTVSQLSAVFEKVEPPSNPTPPQRRSAPALAPKPKPPARGEAVGRKVGGDVFNFEKCRKSEKEVG